MYKLEKILEILDDALIKKESACLTEESFKSHVSEKFISLIDLTFDLINADFEKVINYFETKDFCFDNILSFAYSTERNSIEEIRSYVLNYIDEERGDECKIRTYECLCMGIACLEMYCQTNYTGPEFTRSFSKTLEYDEDINNKDIHQQLECDGCYPFPLCYNPHLLLISRCLLSVLAFPHLAYWKKGIQLTPAGEIARVKSSQLSLTDCTEFNGTLALLPSRFWWSGRAAVRHVRVQQQQNYDELPTLFKEISDSFQQVLTRFCAVEPGVPIIEKTFYDLPIKSVSDYTQHSSAILAAQGWLEWGLCCHFMDFSDKGRRAFHRAQAAAGLETELTGGMGKRTKYQRTDHAQLILLAKSSLKRGSRAPVEASEKGIPETNTPIKNQENLHNVSADQPVGENTGGEPVETTEGWQHGEWEMGRRLVVEGAGGEEAAVRQVALDAVDGGAQQNIVLEGGPHLSEEAKAEVAEGTGLLHIVDQAVVLALCLDVANSNPEDPLSNEERQAFVEKVLQQEEAYVNPKTLSTERGSNWMVFSTALLERSWLEFERSKTRDRAMLQIQALLDQHCSRLTLLQSSRDAVSTQAASAHERLQFIHSLVYPAQFELKRDLAHRYLRCQVFMSALHLFQELEMWDEVVTCYQLLDKPHRAELVVREQLKSRESPYMITALADLTGKEDLYERAWTLSKGRYPRAKRTLAKICHDRGDFEACCSHLDAALAVQPLVSKAWYLKGIACMRLERWDDAVQAFVRCVQQDMEIGQAWGNIGAIHLKLRRFDRAYEALTEAVKQQHDNWRLLENLLQACMGLSKWREALLQMTRLLDMRHKSNNPLHLPQLQHIAMVAAHQQSQIQGGEAGREGLAGLAKVVQEYLGKACVSLPSDAALWDVAAEFHGALGWGREAKEDRLKQLRVLITQPSWEKDIDKIEKIISTSNQYVLALLDKQFVAEKTELYAGKMVLMSIAREIEGNNNFNGEKQIRLEHSCGTIKSLIQNIDDMYCCSIIE